MKKLVEIINKLGRYIMNFSNKKDNNIIQLILDDDILNILLIDQTTHKNIIWANNDYQHIDRNYTYNTPILNRDIHRNIIKPGYFKNKIQKDVRRKKNAEVFTPSWLCNIQNNLIDKEWFRETNVFNYEKNKSWITNSNRIIFPKEEGKNWKEYIYDTRLEVTCGEAPYIVSRYDSVTGEFINITDRIGILDRKIRVINENVAEEEEWLKWIEIAFQSVYGFEFNGDSLFIARENLLLSFCDYMLFKFNRYPTKKELLNIANIISWNIWQMDFTTFSVPYHQIKYEQMNLFDVQGSSYEPAYCIIKDWKYNKKMLFKELIMNGEI